MSLDHERLDVYRAALEFLTLATRVVGALPRGRSDLADQLDRASTSIVLNIAEGAGKFSRPEKRRYYQIAAGSVTECAAILDVCSCLTAIDAGTHAEGKALAERMLAMLVKLSNRMQRG